MKKILVPVDGSKLSSYVVELAIEFAAAMKSQIMLLTVIPENNIYAEENIYNLEQTQANIDAQSMIHEETKKNADRMLDSLVEKIHRDNITIEKSIKSGIPEDEILKAAESGQFDLIVIGNRGLSPTKKFFLGSVSKEVITEAKCPVLVAKQP